MSKARDLANAGTALTTVSATELGYLDGVTSAVQTQIDSKIGSASAINPTIVDAKGDIIAATAADTVARLAVGANDTVLTADSSTATGLKWATPSAGGMTLITEAVLSASTGYSFSSIPSTYKQLLLVWGGIQHSANAAEWGIRLNANSGSVYQQAHIQLNANSVSVQTLSRTSISTSQGLPFGYSATVSGREVQGTLLIDNYSSSTKLKRYNCTYGYFDNEAAVDRYADITGTYNSTSAITSIDITRLAGTATISNVTNTSVRLYGVS